MWQIEVFSVTLFTGQSPFWRPWPVSSLDRTCFRKPRSFTWSCGCSVWWDDYHISVKILWHYVRARIIVFVNQMLWLFTAGAPRVVKYRLTLSGLHHIPVLVWNGVGCWNLRSRRKGVFPYVCVISLIDAEFCSSAFPVHVCRVLIANCVFNVLLKSLSLYFVFTGVFLLTWMFSPSEPVRLRGQ